MQAPIYNVSHETISLRNKRVIPFVQIFSTGSITVTAPSVANVQAAVEHIYPKVINCGLPLLTNCMNSTGTAPARVKKFHLLL
jgi:hypothetical protein